MTHRTQRSYFLKSEHIGFSKWTPQDVALAKLLWGDPQVTRYICSTGIFSPEDILNRLHIEIENDQKYQVQYWPIFELASGELIGCCGLRPKEQQCYEIGFHLRPKFWGWGYATESANTVIDYAFEHLNAFSIFAGHNPQNIASQKRLLYLGFTYIGDEYYAPTGLYHPSYRLFNKK